MPSAGGWVQGALSEWHGTARVSVRHCCVADIRCLLIALAFPLDPFAPGGATCSPTPRSPTGLLLEDSDDGDHRASARNHDSLRHLVE
jgi:hypothetical protein